MSQRCLSPTSTTSEISSSTRLRMNDASWFVSRSRYTASGIVCVRPGKFPANVIVAPNSPSARAQQSTAPAMSEGRTSGRVTRHRTVQRLAPSVRAASSNRVSIERRGARLDGDNQKRHRDESLREDGAGRGKRQMDSERCRQPAAEEASATEREEQSDAADRKSVV